VQHDRPDTDRFRYYLGSLFGLGTGALHGRDTVPDRFKLFHAGGLGMQTRPPEVLERLVRDFFEVPAAVREFTGGWLRLPEALCCRLGVEADSSRLGRGAVAGTRILQRQQRFRLRIGPLRLADFKRFLPRGTALGKLRDLVRLAAGLELEWDLHLGLLAAEVPAATLDGKSALGWTSWLPTGMKRTEDAWDLVLFRPGEPGGAAEMRA
jgi:type VI secretion system protein ImpH